MSEQWSQAAFGQPPPQGAQQLGSPPTPGSGATVSSLDVYDLPTSITESQHWQGSPANPEEAAAMKAKFGHMGDLTFGVREPTAREVQDRFVEGADPSRVFPHFITLIGDTPVPDYTVAERWWHKLPAKAQKLILDLIMEQVVPTEDEGKALRLSRRPAGVGANSSRTT